MTASDVQHEKPVVRGRVARLAALGLLALAGAVVLTACTGGGEVSLDVSDLSVSTYEGDQAVAGTDVTLSELLAEGKPVVVNFWAALCAPCRAEMPDFQRVHEARRDEVTILGVDIGPQLSLGTRQQGRELLAELGITYLVGTTFDEDVVRDFRVVGMPTTLFLYPDGRLLRRWSGLLNEAKVNEFVDQLVVG